MKNECKVSLYYILLSNDVKLFLKKCNPSCKELQINPIKQKITYSCKRIISIKKVL